MHVFMELEAKERLKKDFDFNEVQLDVMLSRIIYIIY